MYLRIVATNVRYTMFMTLDTNNDSMTLNRTNGVVDQALDQWNDAVAGILTPLTATLILYLVVGCFGNTSVLYVYWWKIRSPSKDRFFIPILALMDMATCLICAGAGVYANLNPLKFESDVGCKMVAFISILFATGSADLLVIIAVDRYLKICCPFGTQMADRWKKISLAVLFVVSSLIAFPAIFVYGSVPVAHPVYNMTGWRCVNVAQNGRYYVWELTYKALLFDYSIIRFVALTVMYIRIGNVVFKHFKRHSEMQLMRSSHFVSLTQHCDRQNQNGALSSDTDNNSSLDGRCCWRKRKPNNVEVEYESGINGSNVTHANRTDKKGMRLTLIFMLITGIYILTFGPKVVLMTFETLHSSFWTTMTSGELVGFRFLYTFFIVNNVVNPFIYGFLDEQFRKELFCQLPRRA